ncbi:MAG TPA: sulfatase-like hydrolase/transferase [Terriglobales bacterium]|nr:sulfatase-like hydrolase/transferase [Terriglobales bacterium]
MKALRVAIFIIAMTPALLIGQATPRKSPPNVFLITLDTLRADHVHCYGYEKIQTPALDALARDGTRFTQAFTPSPITNSSHTSIMTALLPSHHGVTDFAIPLDASHTTLADALQAGGYHTAAFIGAVILDAKTLAPGLDHGFDYYDNFPEHPRSKSRFGRLERRAMDVTQHAENWLTAHPAGPHFAWLHFYDAHDPYEPPAPFSETYKDRLYDGEIAYVDSAVAHFTAYLKRRGWYDNSIIIAVGDHGEGLGEHHENTHGIFLYDSTTHVPLIVKLPAQNHAAKVVDAQVRTTDILPTVLDELKIDLPKNLDGESLRACLDGSDTKGFSAFGETDYPLRFGWAALRSVRANGVKFIEAPRPELYDLHADAGELQNTYQADNKTVAEFRGMLADLRPPANAEAAPKLPDPKDKIEEQNLLHSAMMATDDNRVPEAREALGKVLESDAKSSTALRQIGELELNAGNYPKAAEYLTRARQLLPDDASVALNQGKALQKTGDLAGARDALEASLKQLPAQLPARIILGEVYLGLKDAKAAEDQFEAAMLLQPNSVEAQLGSSKAQIQERNFSDALSQLQVLAKSQPNNAEVFELLDQAYSGLGKTDEAARAAARSKLLRK